MSEHSGALYALKGLQQIWAAARSFRNSFWRKWLGTRRVSWTTRNVERQPCLGQILGYGKQGQRSCSKTLPYRVSPHQVCLQIITPSPCSVQSRSQRSG